jgi:predicted phosphate transport protein (TIGR00153 family)
MVLSAPSLSFWDKRGVASVRFSLIPRNSKFYDLFEESANNLVVAGEALADLFEHFENLEMKTAHLKELEHAGDNVTHELYRQIHLTFVTPLDREDIAALAQRMDDVMDFIEGASTAVRTYGIEKPTEAARGLADLVRLQCLQIQQAIQALRHRGQLKKSLEQLKEINRLENEADALFLQATAELFQGEMNIVEIIKWRDIYDQLEQATDSAEHVAHVLEAIVLKHA